jgi:hypothetical protein
MTKEEFEALQPGDLVRHISGTETSTVSHHVFDEHGNHRILIVRTVVATRADEWELIGRHTNETREKSNFYTRRS